MNVVKFGLHGVAPIQMMGRELISLIVHEFAEKLIRSQPVKCEKFVTIYNLLETLPQTAAYSVTSRTNDLTSEMNFGFVRFATAMTCSCVSGSSSSPMAMSVMQEMPSTLMPQ